MKITLIQIGKTRPKYLEEGIADFEKRLGRFAKYEVITIQDVKGKYEPEELKKREEEKVLDVLGASDYLVLLDENGQQFSSRKFANWMEKKASTQGTITFLIGGAYGFSEAMYQRAQAKVSLSSMTYSHQMIRLIFSEQIYRAMTILKGHPYHND